MYNYDSRIEDLGSEDFADEDDDINNNDNDDDEDDDYEDEDGDDDGLQVVRKFGASRTRRRPI